MVADERRMLFYESIYDLASIMSEKSRRNLLVAFLDYFFAGEEPEKLSANERKAFEAVRGRIDASKTNGCNRRGKKRNETDNGTRNETRNENDNENDNETRDSMRTDKSPSLSPSLSPSSSGMDEGCYPIGEWVQGEGFAPPTLDEARAYFGANLLPGDPDAFWAHYDSQGWTKGNGLPVSSWTSLALKWGIEERRRELATTPDQLPKKLSKPVNGLDPADDLERLEREFREKYGGDA